jgi:hypothetical protein
VAVVLAVEDFERMNAAIQDAENLRAQRNAKRPKAKKRGGTLGDLERQMRLELRRKLNASRRLREPGLATFDYGAKKRSALMFRC